MLMNLTEWFEQMLGHANRHQCIYNIKSSKVAKRKRAQHLLL